MYHTSTASPEVDSLSTFSDVNKLPRKTSSIGATANKIPTIEMRQPTLRVREFDKCGGGGGGHESVPDTWSTLGDFE